MKKIPGVRKYKLSEKGKNTCDICRPCTKSVSIESNTVNDIETNVSDMNLY